MVLLQIVRLLVIAKQTLSCSVLILLLTPWFIGGEAIVMFVCEVQLHKEMRTNCKKILLLLLLLPLFKN